MNRVRIVGAGMAGLSAALRLLERGFHVTLYEQDDFIGGMLRSYQDKNTQERREHSYHMFMNWYYNFWQIAEEIDIKHNFTPREAFKFLYKGKLHDMPELVNPGGPQDFMRNVTSGAAPLPDLFIFMYSMIDLLSQPIHRDRFLDKYSVNAFMRSRPYATDKAADLHQRVWETVWAISSYQASAMSYKNFLKYGNRVPVPQLWLLKGNKFDYLLKPLLERLEEYNKDGDRFELKKLHRLNKIECSDKYGKQIDTLIFEEVNISPSVNPGKWKKKQGTKPVTVSVGDQDVILAVTPSMLAELAVDELFDADPKLGDARHLQSEPMASVELHFKSKHKGIPNDVTVFMDAKYQMTFLDYTQLWPDQHNTFLYITISDFKSLLSVPAENRPSGPQGHLHLDLDHPKTAIDYILSEVKASMPFDIDDIDLKKTNIQTNTGEQLFANDVGSWTYRPTTETKLPNLYLAGTYCRNLADVATIEGAVISGLNAAECVRKKAGVGQPIEVIHPGYYPEELFMALKVLWAPYAAGAKLWSMANEALEPFNGAWAPDANQGTKSNPSNLGSLFWDFLPKSLWSKEHRGLGPLYWDYNPDGSKRS